MVASNLKILIKSNIKAFIHPFNGFSRIETNYSNHGEVVLNIEYTYTESEIKEMGIDAFIVVSDVSHVYGRYDKHL